MKTYHGKRNQLSVEDKEEYISPKEMIDKVSDDDFIDMINELASDKWLERYSTDWLISLRKEVNEQRAGYLPEKKKKALSKAILGWCEASDVHFGVGLAEGKYFYDVAQDMAANLLEYPFAFSTIMMKY